ncbi:hypothetical protein Q4I28_003470 [Leishmania naiffi]|uniref:Uncharacterized protein n=1 Tax=Leishmania naiffi TaxID=5678 RepID=A0AAW3BT57_9TRYP
MSSTAARVIASATAPPLTLPSRNSERHLPNFDQFNTHAQRQQQLLFQPLCEEEVAYNKDNNGVVHHHFYLSHVNSVAVTPVRTCLVDSGGCTVSVASISFAALITGYLDGVRIGTMSAPVGLHCVTLMVDGKPVLKPYPRIGCLHRL